MIQNSKQSIEARKVTIRRENMRVAKMQKREAARIAKFYRDREPFNGIKGIDKLFA